MRAHLILFALLFSALVQSQEAKATPEFESALQQLKSTRLAMAKDPGLYKKWFNENKRFSRDIPWPKTAEAWGRIRSEYAAFYQIVPLEALEEEKTAGLPVDAFYSMSDELGQKILLELLEAKEWRADRRITILLSAMRRAILMGAYSRAKKMKEDAASVPWLAPSEFFEYVRLAEGAEGSPRFRQLVSALGIQISGKLKLGNVNRIEDLYRIYMEVSLDLCNFEEVERIGTVLFASWKAISRNKNHNLAIGHLAQAQFSLGKTSEARTTLSHLQQQRSGEDEGAKIEIDLLRAQIFSESGMAQAAREIYSRYFQKTPMAFVELGHLEEQEGRLASALVQYQKGLAELLPSFASIMTDNIIRAHMLRVLAKLSPRLIEDLSLLATWQKEPDRLGDNYAVLPIYLILAEYYYQKQDPAGAAALLNRFDSQFVGTGCVRYRPQVEAWSKLLQAENLSKPEEKKKALSAISYLAEQSPAPHPQKIIRSTLLAAIKKQ